MVNLTIDGKKISVPESTTVLNAARSAGIDIPTLCDHPELTPYGGCRLCVVELEGAKTLQTSCTLPVMENMVIHTNTEKVREARKFILTMIFSDRNHFCPYCVVNDGDCELQQAAYDEGMTHWPIQPNWKPYEVDASHPYIVLDHNRCILCRRCVRACSELIGNFTLGVEERGAKTLIMADLGTPLGESSCVSCGACVQVCPTGAIIDRWSAYRGQKEDLQSQKTICIGCSIGCGVNVMTKDNYLIKIEGDWEAEPNHGVLCKVGRFYPLDNQNEKVQSPMVRKAGKLTPVSWEEALSKVSSQLQPFASGKGEAVACLVSNRLPLEAMYLGKEIFGKYLKNSQVTTLDESKTSKLAYRISEKLGKPYQSKLSAIEEADTIVLLGADLIKDHEVASFLVKRSVACGAQLLILDTAENSLDHISTKTLCSKGKADLLTIMDGVSAALHKSKNVDTGISLEKAETLTTISKKDFLTAAELITSAEKLLVIFDDEYSAGNEILVAEKFIEFAQNCGAMEGWNGLLSMKGKANSYAAAQYGLDQPVSLEGQQVIYVALGDDEPSQRLTQTLEKTPFLVVQAAYTSRLTAMADVVLPTAAWGEETGHYLNLDGNIQKAEKFLEPSSSVKSNQEILSQLAAQLKMPECSQDDWQTQLKQRPALTAIEN